MMDPLVGKNHLNIGWVRLVAASSAAFFTFLVRISALITLMYSFNLCTVEFSIKCSTSAEKRAVSMNQALCLLVECKFLVSFANLSFLR